MRATASTFGRTRTSANCRVYSPCKTRLRVRSLTHNLVLHGEYPLQDEITRSIVDALKVKLAVMPSARAVENTEAHDLYLQGLYLSHKSDEESLRKSLNFFQRALG